MQVDHCIVSVTLLSPHHAEFARVCVVALWAHVVLVGASFGQLVLVPPQVQFKHGCPRHVAIGGVLHVLVGLYHPMF